jgi:type I restriction enzyme S subunit
VPRWRVATTTSTEKELPKRDLGKLGEMPVAIPPLAEQHRIVAKVDELMALCDRLEQEVGAGETAHAKLVETLLGTLTQSTDAADLAANWQRLAEHFDTLFTTEASIDALKQTVLQLGVSGRITNTSGFTAAKLGDLLVDACYGTSHKSNPVRANGAYPVLRIPNVVRETLDLTDLKFSVLEEKELLKIRLLDGDIVVVRTNGSAELVGRCAVVNGLPEIFAFASYMIRLRFDPSKIIPEFAQCALRNHRLQNRMVAFARTTAGQYNVSIGRLQELEMPIPPLPEQHRIVAKVDELIALCDQLKADLAESRTRQDRLATTLIETALMAA